MRFREALAGSLVTLATVVSCIVSVRLVDAQEFWRGGLGPSLTQGTEPVKTGHCTTLEGETFEWNQGNVPFAAVKCFRD